MRFSTWKVNNNSTKQILTKKKSEPETYNFLKTDKSFHKFIIFSIQASKHGRKRKFQIEMHYPHRFSFSLSVHFPFFFFLFFSLFVNLEQLQNHSTRVAYNLWKTTRHKRRSAGGAFDNDEGCDKREKQFSLTDVFRAKLAYLIR